MFETGILYNSTYEMPVDGGAATLHDALVFHDAPPVSPYQQVGVGEIRDGVLLTVTLNREGQVTWDETDVNTGEVVVQGDAYFHPDDNGGFNGVWESDPPTAASGPWKLERVRPAAGAVAMAS